MSKLKLPNWLTPAGEPVSCLDKIKVLNENLEEIRELAQDALEDAVQRYVTSRLDHANRYRCEPSGR